MLDRAQPSHNLTARNLKDTFGNVNNLEGFSIKRAEEKGQASVVLKSLIINGVEIKVHDSDLVALLIIDEARNKAWEDEEEG